VKTKTQHGLLQANYEDEWFFNFVPIQKGLARYFRHKTVNARKASRLRSGSGTRNITLRNKTNPLELGLLRKISNQTQRSKRNQFVIIIIIIIL